MKRQRPDEASAASSANDHPRIPEHNTRVDMWSKIITQLQQVHSGDNELENTTTLAPEPATSTTSPLFVFGGQNNQIPFPAAVTEAQETNSLEIQSGTTGAPEQENTIEPEQEPEQENTNENDELNYISNMIGGIALVG